MKNGILESKVITQIRTWLGPLQLKIPDSLALSFKKEQYEDTIIRAKISATIVMWLASLNALYGLIYVRGTGLWEVYPAWKNLLYIHFGWFCYSAGILRWGADWYRKTRLNPVFFHFLFIFSIFVNMSGIQNSGLSIYAVSCAAAALFVLESFKVASLFYGAISGLCLALVYTFVKDPVLRTQLFADTVIIGFIAWALNRYIYFTFIRNFLDKKTIEQQRQKLELELQHRKALEGQVVRSEKMASLGVLSAGVAHEINNPMMIIQGNLELMQDAIQEKRMADIESRTQYLMRAVNRIATIVKGLSSFARTDSTQSVVLNLHDAIQESLAIISPLFSKTGISIRTEFTSRNPQIRVNPGHLQQVLMNLLSNARDALTTVNGDRSIHIKTIDEETGILLSIEDNGQGIPNQHLQKIFDPFFTTKPPGQGTGLGLSISLSMVQSFGGRISAISTPGCGTTLKVFLPRFEAKVTEPVTINANLPAQVAAAVSTLDQKKKSVLIVDDEEEVRDVVVKMLKNFKGEIETACDGVEAFQLLQKRDFDFIITDLQMPRMNGESLIIEANRFKPAAKTRFVIITGNLLVDQQITLHQKLKKIPYHVLEKPFTRDELWKTLAENAAEI